MILLPLFIVACLITQARTNTIYDNDDPVLLPQHYTMVHLHEWKWTDIALECENFLFKQGYGAVQISPPTEHLFREINIDGRGKKDLPWYVRYQPVSYKLISRSGNEEELKDMVNRCNKVGIRIVVDILLNHMAGAGQAFGEHGVNSSGGSFFNSTPNHENFPNASYTKDHFNDYRCNGDIQGNDYNHNPDQVRNCRLSGLVDLNQGHSHVRDVLVGLLNKLVDFGVVGFRLDASKHMHPGDLEAIINRLKPLRKEIFGENKRPFIVHEVIDKGGEAITVSEYVKLGRYTNFNFGIALANAVQNFDGKQFQDLANLHENYGYGNMADHEVLNFVDNHDNQRYEKDHLLTHKKTELYKLGVSFMLAWTYGYPRVMSGYYFDHTDQGPPSSGAPKYETKSPTFTPNDTCQAESGWVCEHRWPEIRRMVKFRRDVTGAAVTAIHKESNLLAFARLGKGYFAANNNDEDRHLTNVDTTLPPGNYCDIYSTDYTQKHNCSPGKLIRVNEHGSATFPVPKRSVVAFSVESKVGGSAHSDEDKQTKNWNKTIIFLKSETKPGEHVFIRGGVASKGGCKQTPSKSNGCSIPIQHKTKIDVGNDLQPSIVYDHYQSWRQGDSFLDFIGGENRQGTHDGIIPEGTPMIWTTNVTSSPTFNAQNAMYCLGDGYWLVELIMDCNRTSDGVFEFKGVRNGEWEQDITCSGKTTACVLNDGNSTVTVNHRAKCGAVNVFSWSECKCQVIKMK